MKKILFLSFLFLMIGLRTGHATINENVWYPDTCNGCAVVYTWNDSVPAENRAHTVKEIKKHDPAHSTMSASDEYAAILEENQRKNKVHGQLLTVSALTQSSTSPDGSTTITIKNGITVTYAYSGADPGRVLTVTISGVSLTSNQKTSIVNWCNTNLGVGKVVLVN